MGKSDLVGVEYCLWWENPTELMFCSKKVLAWVTGVFTLRARAPRSLTFVSILRFKSPVQARIFEDRLSDGFVLVRSEESGP